MINKINAILKKFKQIDAKTWEIGTNFFQSLIEFGKNMSHIKNLENYETISIIEVSSSPKKRYKIVLGGVNVTPSTRSDKIGAEATIRQYLQEGSALRYFNYSEGDKIYKNFNINHNFLKLADGNRENILLERMFIFLVYSTSSSTYFNKNLFYSLFLCLIYVHDENLFYQLDKHFVEPRTIGKNNRGRMPNWLDKRTTIDFIQHIFGLRNKEYGAGKLTYVEVTNKLLNKYGFEKIVDAMYKAVINPESMEVSSSIHDIISQKENIFSNRNYALIEQRLIEAKRRRNQMQRKVYADRQIESIDRWTDFSNTTEYKKSDLQCCHIYAMAKIKKEIIENINNEDKINDLLNMVDDPKNCILLDRISHWMLDETEEIWINNDGRICFLNENEIKEKIIRLFGTTDIRIKSNIFNERMKYYIKEINL